MTVNYFGEIAEITNCTKEEISTNIETLKELIEYLKTNYKLPIEDFYIAINHELVQKDTNLKLNTTDEIAVLSAFAGG